MLFIREATQFAVPFDADRIDVLGEPTPVLDGVRTAVTNGSAQYAFSTSGTLVYKRGGLLGSKLPLARADRTGATTILPAAPAEFFDVRLSPDESRLALHVANASAGSGGASIHVYDLERETMSRLALDGQNWAPIWSPDGQWIVFSSSNQPGSSGITWNIHRTRSDGAGRPERLTTNENDQVPKSFSADGKLLFYK